MFSLSDEKEVGITQKDQCTKPSFYIHVYIFIRNTKYMYKVYNNYS